jgi:MFS family permease
MTLEERLRTTFEAADEYVPSPDLFAKVQRSIEEERTHRRRAFGAVAVVAGLLAIGIAWILAFLEVENGTVALPWRSLEVLVTVIEVAIVLAVGPLIRRFGKTYVADVFQTNPLTGARFLALFDVAFYLVFFAYIVLFMFFEPSSFWLGSDGLVVQVRESVYRIAGLLLLIGGLHAVTIFVLPFVGLVFASTRHRILVHTPKDQWDPEVRRAHRTVTVVLWIVVGLTGLWLLQLVLGLMIGAIAGMGG